MSERIKVAIVLPYFGPGGAEAMVARLAARIDSERFQTEVFCVYGEPQGNHLEENLHHKDIPIHFIGKKKGPSLSAALRLYRALDLFSPHVVHTHLYACVYAALWPVLKNRKILHTLHTLPDVENKRLSRRLLTRWLVKSGRMVPVAISGTNQRLIADFYHIDCKRVPVIQNPVDTERFASAPKEPAEGFRFVTVGRLSAVKNQQMMLRAFALFREAGCDANLEIIGAGQEETELKALAAELGISNYVKFIGYVVNVEDYLARADVFLLSSLYEAQPLAVLEAMAAGLPVIATDVGGVADIVTDNGILVPSEDAEAMARAMERIYSDGDLRKQMAQCARRNAAHYDADHTAQQYMELYSAYAKTES